jgi:phage gp29-like protein
MATALKKSKIPTKSKVKVEKPSKTLVKTKSADQPPRPLDVNAVVRIPNPAQRFSRVIGSDAYQIARSLSEAIQGDNEAYLTLALEMEERYLHYASVLQTRKQAVTGEAMTLTPGDDSDRGREITDLCRKYLIETPQFEELGSDLLDAISKGYSVVQPHWDTTTPLWTIREYEWIDPRLFVFDRLTLSQLRLRQDGTVDGIEIPEGQFIIHRPKLRTGIPIRAGLARLAAVAYMFHAEGVKEWSIFTSTFGMPTRIGSYTPGVTSDQEIAELRTAIMNIAHDAACLVPDTTKLTLQDGRRPTSGDNVFEGFIDYWDSAVSKVVLGQTMTTEDGSSLGQAQVHNEVRLEIKKSDARQVAATKNQQVIRPWILYNFGPDAPVPSLAYDVEPDEDLKAFGDALVPFINAGLPVRSRDIYERFGLSAPEDGDDIVGGKPKPLDPAAPTQPLT